MATDPALAMEPELTDAIGVATVAAVTTGSSWARTTELSARAAGATEMERVPTSPARSSPARNSGSPLFGCTSTCLTSRRPEPRTALFIEEFGRGLDKAIRELSDTARTSTSTNLTRQGLGAALRAARNGSPITVRVSDRGVRRHPPRVELAVYYCSLEAIQNSIKHAGPTASVTVRLFESSNGIGFAIEDDGLGFDADAVALGSGLQNIRERVAALGGTVSVDSRPGRGTVISGSIPDRVGAGMSGFGRAGAPTFAVEPLRRSRETEQHVVDPVLRRVSTWFLGPAVLSAVWWTVTSPHFGQPEFRAAFLAYAIAAPGLIGLLWWHRRPQSNFGPLLTVFGFAAWPLCLQGSGSPVLFSMGVLAEAPYAFLTFLLCLAFPRGRITSAFDTRLLLAWAIVLVIGWIPYLAMLPTLEGGGPLSACAPACPTNYFQVMQPAAGLLTFVGQVGTVTTIVFAALLVGQQVVRLWLASPALRRARWPVVASTSAFLVAFAGYHLYRALVPMSPYYHESHDDDLHRGLRRAAHRVPGCPRPR